MQVACRNLCDSTDYSLQQSIMDEYILVFGLKSYMYRVELLILKSVSLGGSLAGLYLLPGLWGSLNWDSENCCCCHLSSYYLLLSSKQPQNNHQLSTGVGVWRGNMQRKSYGECPEVTLWKRSCLKTHKLWWTGGILSGWHPPKPEDWDLGDPLKVTAARQDYRLSPSFLIPTLWVSGDFRISL